VNQRTSISYDGVSGGTTYGDGSGNNINFVYNAIFNSGNINLTVKKPDGSTFDVNFSTANYSVNPVLKDTVYDLGGGKKLGYFVFNSFTSDANADPKLDAVFTKFSNAGVTDVAIDLRYNGGGYVSTAEYIDNYLVPTAKDNTLMYNTYFNSILSSNTETLLKNQVRKDDAGALYNLSQIDYSLNSPYNTPKFAKKGNLNIGRVFFIVTGGTASASELTINNLRPVLDVELIGETSYGKPVGFFDIGINKYTLFTPEFSTKNSANQGDYFDGFTPGATGLPGVNDFDDYTKDFGDPTEKLLGHIIKKITTNTYNVPTKVIQSVDPAQRTFSLAESRDKTMLLNKHKFAGMLFNFKKVQLKAKK
ncbi:MAG: S41 family peptidase, partial [Mucilaginibacter sp.]